MLWDTHMHSQYSGDSDAPQEDMIRAAIRAKLPGICFTDHLDIDYPDNPEAYLLDLPNYTSSVFAMQEQYRDQISVRYGIELGLQPHLAALHADILSQYDFDFVIGSSHVVHGYDPYFPPPACNTAVWPEQRRTFRYDRSAGGTLSRTDTGR